MHFDLAQCKPQSCQTDCGKQKGHACRQAGFAPILLLIPILILALVSGVYYFGKLPIKPTDNPKACTQEAKQCPDGSFVSRTGPNCEFSPCPSALRKPTHASPVPKGTGETANWKTYKNAKYGYQISYPMGKIWAEEERASTHQDIVHSLGIDITTKEDGDIPLFIRVWKDLGVKISNIKDRDNWCSLVEDQLSKEEYSQIDCSYKGEFTETSVGGQKAFKAKGGRDNGIAEIYYIPHKDYVIQIEIAVGGLSESGMVDFSMSNQILSTFKFIP